MNKRLRVSFAHMGNYYIPFSLFVGKVLSCECIIPPFTTKKTTELGCRYSPTNVCMPFKYNVGNFIEAIGMGANVIIQAGGGCIFGNYHILQEKILEEIDKDIIFVDLFDKNDDKTNGIVNTYRKCKSINPKLNIFRFLYYSLLTILMIIYMDLKDRYVRKRRCYEKKDNSFSNILDLMREDFIFCSGYLSFFKTCIKTNFRLLKVPLVKLKKRYRVLVVGELFTLMDKYANCNIYEILNNLGVEVESVIDLTNLVIMKKTKFKRCKKNKYVKYHLGATGTYTIYKSLKAVKKGYDGIIHMKSSFCTPEVSASYILNEISKDKKIPVLFLSFDDTSSDEAYITRLEAFIDMIKMKGEIHE